MVNKIKRLPKHLQDTLEVVSRIAQSEKIRVYLVGGIVRDLLIGRRNLDLDIVVEGDAISFAHKVAHYLGCEYRRHHTFGTAVVYGAKAKIDFATARTESYSQWGALPKVKTGCLKDDLLRRDFTINAMAISLNKNDYGKLIDFYGGRQDLKKKQIRILHNKSFLEDPTRILRAVRFEQRFSFHLAKVTRECLKEAIDMQALSFVHNHRLKDELILILQEPNPYPYIKRIEALCGFKFLDPAVKLNTTDYLLFRRIHQAISYYTQTFRKYRELDVWILYLAVFLIKLPHHKLLVLFHDLGFRKGDRIRILSIKTNISRFKKLNQQCLPHQVYRIIDHLSFETIIFLYAYHKSARLRRNIHYFLDELVSVRIKIKGKDLKRMGIKPQKKYSAILNTLFDRKLDKGLTTKAQEMQEVKDIARRMRVKAE